MFTYPVGRFDTYYEVAGYDLKVTLIRTGDTLTVKDWFSDPTKQLDYFRYAGLTNAYAFIGDDGVNSYAAQTDDNYKMVTFGANDSLTGAAGHDILVGGAGADTLNGGAGVDGIEKLLFEGDGVTLDLTQHPIATAGALHTDGDGAVGWKVAA